jgi:hypothetical protein
MNTENLTKVELVLMERALRSPDGIFVAQVTLSLGISVRDASSAFKNLRNRGFLTIKGSTLHLTSKGRGWIMANQRMFAFSGEKSWRIVPERFEASQINPFDPYAPRVSKLSNRSFPIGGKGDV